MNPNNNPENMEEFSEEIELGSTDSIDAFIRELEEREKDLHISGETIIEVEDSDFDDQTVAEFILNEAAVIPEFDDNLNELNEPESSLNDEEIEDLVVETYSPNPLNDSKDPREKTKVFELEREVKRLNEKIAKIESERSELFELSRRRQTDFDNFKKRTERDKHDTFSHQLGNLAVGVLPVLDNLDRAMEAASNIDHKKSPDFQQFFDGIVLVNKQLNEVLSEMGVKPIGAIGEIFDPHFHEAVATEESDDFEANMVLDEMLRGYLLGDKVIRPSMVKVSKSASSGNPPSDLDQLDRV
jgi:molecular chaperone GrpE